MFLLFVLTFILKAQVTNFTEGPSLKTLLAVNNPHFVRVDLDYDQSFHGSVSHSYGPELKVPYCYFQPSQLLALYSTGRTSVASSWITSGAPQNFFIEYLGADYFFAKSSQFGLYIAGSGGHMIGLDPTLTALVGGSGAPVFMVLDPINQMVYLINKQFAFAYSITDFHTELSLDNPPPDININAFVPEFTFSNIAVVKYYQSRIYIVADNNVYIYQTSAPGALTFVGQYDSTVFGASPPGLVDIAFKDNYAFVLDKTMGVFTIDITGPAEVSAMRMERQRGKFLEVTENSLLIISETSSLIYEYLLIDSPISSVEFNQYLKITQSNYNVRQTASDINYLYLLTDENVLVVRHSIPARFYDKKMQPFLETIIFNPQLAIKAGSATSDGISKPLVLGGALLSQNIIEPTPPRLNCLITNVPGCIFTLDVQGVQKTCNAKQISTSVNDPRSVCLIDQKLDVIVLNSPYTCPDASIVAPTGLQQTSDTVVLNMPDLVSQGKNKEASFKNTAENERVDKVENLVRDVPKGGQLPNNPIKAKTSDVTYTPNKNVASRNRDVDRTGETNNPFDNQARRANILQDGLGKSVVQNEQNVQGNELNNIRRENPAQKGQSQPVNSSPLKASTTDMIIDVQKTQVENMIEMMNENNELINRLIISVMVLFVIVILLSVYIVVKFRNGKERQEKNEDKDEEEEEEEEDDFVVSTENSKIRKRKEKRKQKLRRKVELSTTFGDESKINIDMDLSKINEP